MISEDRLIEFNEAIAHGFLPSRNFGFASAQPAIPVHLSELGQLVSTLPLAFAKMQTGQLLLVVVSGFGDGRNQFVDERGNWASYFVPQELLLYPFGLRDLGNNSDGKRNFGVSFKHTSGLYRENPDISAGEQRFFDDAGEPQPLFKTITEQLQKLLGQQRQTQRAVQALQNAELLVPWQIQPREGHPDELLPKGLYRVDEAKLNGLKGEALEKLHSVHALALAYGQLLSMSRIAVLQRLKDARVARQAKVLNQNSAASAGPVDAAIVQQLFDAPQGDTLKFNF